MLIVYILFTIIAVILVIAAFSPNSWSIEAEININKPNQEVFDYLKLLCNSEKYNKWVMTDPNMKKTLTGTDGNVGFIYAWDSQNKQAGKGEQEIKHLENGKKIDCEIRFIKPFEAVSTTTFLTNSVSENETQIIWIFNGRNNYIMKVMHVLMNLKKVLIKDMLFSLNNLKTILEK